MNSVRVFLSNAKLIIACCTVIALTGLAASILTHDGNWFARAGALIVALGLGFCWKSAVVGDDLKKPVLMSQIELIHNDSARYQNSAQPEPAAPKQDSATRKSINFSGPAVSVVGTIIWGFGDLIPF